MTGEHSPQALKLLVVADCPIQSQALQQAFVTSTHLDVLNVFTTTQAATFLTTRTEATVRTWPDLVIIDLPTDPDRLPACHQLVQRMKSHPGLRGLPLMLLAEENAIPHQSPSPNGHLCSLIRKPAEQTALEQMALHFGVYWGTVARVPPNRFLPENNEPKNCPARELVPCNVEWREWTARRPIEILVVDDNDDDATIFQESLAGLEGIRVTQIFDDGDAALEFLRGQRQNGTSRLPDLVVLDIHMPQKTGLTLLEEIKADQFLRNFPVVMLTASQYETDIWETYSRGACTFVEKPPQLEWFREIAARFANYWTCIANVPPQRDQ